MHLIKRSSLGFCRTQTIQHIPTLEGKLPTLLHLSSAKPNLLFRPGTVEQLQTFKCSLVNKSQLTMGDSASQGSSAASKSHNLFQVYLRLRPPTAGASSTERFISVEPPATDAPSTAPTHVTLNPPNDRRRAIEKFAFTQVFEEDATQLDVFHCTNVVPLVEGVLAPHGGYGTDALLATLGVTGSGKVSSRTG